MSGWTAKDIEWLKALEDYALALYSEVKHLQDEIKNAKNPEKRKTKDEFIDGIHKSIEKIDDTFLNHLRNVLVRMYE